MHRTQAIHTLVHKLLVRLLRLPCQLVQPSLLADRVPGISSQKRQAVQMQHVLVMHLLDDAT